MKNLKTIFKNIPIHIAGIALACASMGKYLSSYNIYFKNIFGIIALILFIIITLKLIIYPKITINDLKDPIKTAIYPTYPMCLMLLSTYIINFKTFALIIWFIGLLLLLFVDIYFILKHFIHFKFKNLYYLYLIPFISICIIPMTAKPYNMIILGKVFCIIALTLCTILVPLMIYKHIKLHNVPTPLLPTFCVFDAPFAICLVAYMSIYKNLNSTFITILIIIAMLMFLVVLFKLPKMLKVKFYPSYTAFTFPVLISATAMKMADVYFQQANFLGNIVHIFSWVEGIIAFILLIYTIIRFAMYYSKSANFN